MREQPTVIWQASNAQDSLSTYEAYKTIDEIASLHPARLMFEDGERADRDQLLRYAQRRHLAPAVRVLPCASRDDIEELRKTGINRLIFRIDSWSRIRHDAMHGAMSFGATLRAMRYAADEHIPIEVETRVTKENVADLAKIAEIITTFHASEWLVVFPVPPLRAGETMITAAEAEQALATLSTIETRSGLRVRTVEAPHFIRFGGHAIRDVVFIGSNGEVRPGESSKIAAGNVRFRPLQTVVMSGAFHALADPSNLRGKCGRCEFRGDCGGSRARAAAMTGDLFAPDPLCSYQPSVS
jgi:MoaA/NifB/PqqE/SkfB family radical SAM enzyme